MPDLYVLEIAAGDSGFTATRFEPDAWRARPQKPPESFSVAMVLASIAGADADLAYDCDFLAVAVGGSIETRSPIMLRRRAGAALSGSERTIQAARLHELGLAAFLIDTDVEATERGVLRQADTLLALKQARKVSAPDWFNRQ